MEAPHLERKLVAILAADIEGFSSHMFTVCSQYSICLYKIKYRTTPRYTGNVDPIWNMFGRLPTKLDYN